MQQRVLVVVALAGWLAASFFAGLFIASRPAPEGGSLRSRTTRPDADSHRVVAAADTSAQPRVSLTGIDSLEGLVDRISAAYQRPVLPHWQQIPVSRSAPLSFDLPEADLDTIMRLIAGQLGSFSKVDYRVFPDHVELASPQFFDSQELTAVTYDLNDLVRAMQAAAPANAPVDLDTCVIKIVGTLVSTVEPDIWMDNGGDLGRITQVGSGLLIDCPRRLHPQVEWVLKQLKQSPGGATGLAGIFGSGKPATAAPGATPPAATPASTPAPPVTEPR